VKVPVDEFIYRASMIIQKSNRRVTNSEDNNPKNYASAHRIMAKKREGLAAVASSRRVSKSAELEAFDEARPKIFQSYSFMQRLWEELRAYHRWVGAFLHFSEHFPRALRLLSLSTNITVMLFLQAMTYSLRNPDDGSCERQKDESNCLKLISPFRFNEAKCYWSSTNTQCHFRSPDNELDIMLYVAAIVGIGSAPIVILIDWIIMNILAAPTNHLQPRIAPFSENNVINEFDVRKLDELLLCDTIELEKQMEKYRESLFGEKRQTFDSKCVCLSILYN
jgi:hypothetical protein